MRESRSNPAAPGFPADLLVKLDRSGEAALRDQLERELRRAIHAGRLVRGSRLPPTRTLARQLGVARTVVVDAYGQLIAEGYLEAQQGSGTRVRHVTDPPRRERTRRDGDRPHTAQLVGGLPDPALFPRREWQRQYRAVLGGLPDAAFRYPDARGAAELRTALRSYLGRVRGVLTTPERMLVTSGFTQALVLICRTLRARGVERVAVENPCFAFHRRAIANTGLRPIPVPVDDDGIDVAVLGQHEVGAVLVAPAHSYPTGAVLSAERRIALVSWAQARDVLIIEDDYDAEFRYDRAPVGALQGLAPDHVVYGGGTSKTLSPVLRLGWLAAPSGLVDELVREKFYDDMGSGLLEQLTVARLYDDGGFARHLRRVRPIYRRRRDAALTALSTQLPEARPRGIGAGLHVFVELPRGCDEKALVRAAHQRGVQLEGAAWHWADPNDDRPPAVVLGYGAVAEPAIARSIELLGDAYREVRLGASPP